MRSGPDRDFADGEGLGEAGFGEEPIRSQTSRKRSSRLTSDCTRPEWALRSSPKARKNTRRNEK